MDRKGDSTFRAGVGTECGKRRKSKLEASACTWLGTLGCVCVFTYVTAILQNAYLGRAMWALLPQGHCQNFLHTPRVHVTNG